MPRLFLAIPVDTVIRDHLADVQRGLKPQFKHSQITWTNPDKFHITVHFLGDVDEVMVEQLRHELAAMKYPRPFKIHLGPIDAFPNKKNPKVVFAGMSFHPFLLLLRKVTANVIVGLGLDIDLKPYEPHITLARFTTRSETLQPEKHATLPFTLEVKKFQLLESLDGREGKVYRVLTDFPLE